MITIPSGTTEMQGILACFTFSLANPERTGRGLARLVKDAESEDWKAATILFSVEDLVGHEEDVKERPEGVWDNHAKAWEEVKAERIQSVEDDPTVLIGAWKAFHHQLSYSLRSVVLMVSRRRPGIDHPLF